MTVASSQSHSETAAKCPHNPCGPAAHAYDGKRVVRLGGSPFCTLVKGFVRGTHYNNAFSERTRERHVKR